MWIDSRGRQWTNEQVTDAWSGAQAHVEKLEPENDTLRQRVAELEAALTWAQGAYGFLATYGKGWGSVRLIEDAPAIVKRKVTTSTPGEGE